MRPKPHRVRYESGDYLGIQPFETGVRRLHRGANKAQRRPTKYDLMWHYRFVHYIQWFSRVSFQLRKFRKIL